MIKSGFVLTYKNLGEGSGETAQTVKPLIGRPITYVEPPEPILCKEKTKLSSDLHIHTETQVVAHTQQIKVEKNILKSMI